MEKGNVCLSRILMSRILITGKKIGKGLKYFEKDFFSEMEKDAEKGNKVERANCYGQGLLTYDKNLLCHCGN